MASDDPPTIASDDSHNIASAIASYDTHITLYVGQHTVTDVRATTSDM